MYALRNIYWCGMACIWILEKACHSRNPLCIFSVFNFLLEHYPRRRKYYNFLIICIYFLTGKEWEILAFLFLLINPFLWRLLNLLCFCSEYTTSMAQPAAPKWDQTKDALLLSLSLRAWSCARECLGWILGKASPRVWLNTGTPPQRSALGLPEFKDNLGNRHVEGFLGLSCAGSGVRFNGLCWSLPLWDILWFHDCTPAVSALWQWGHCQEVEVWRRRKRCFYTISEGKSKTIPVLPLLREEPSWQQPKFLCSLHGREGRRDSSRDKGKGCSSPWLQGCTCVPSCSLLHQECQLRSCYLWILLHTILICFKSSIIVLGSWEIAL